MPEFRSSSWVSPSAPPEAAAIAEAFLRAWTSGDMAAAQAMTHQEFHFLGPIAEWHSAADHLDGLRPVASILRRVDLHRAFVDDGDAVLVYDLVTDTPVGTARIAEWNTIRDGRISEIRAFFDSLPWRSAGFSA